MSKCWLLSNMKPLIAQLISLHVHGLIDIECMEICASMQKPFFKLNLTAPIVGCMRAVLIVGCT